MREKRAYRGFCATSAGWPFPSEPSILRSQALGFKAVDGLRLGVLDGLGIPPIKCHLDGRAIRQQRNREVLVVKTRAFSACRRPHFAEAGAQPPPEEHRDVFANLPAAQGFASSPPTRGSTAQQKCIQA